MSSRESEGNSPVADVLPWGRRAALLQGVTILDLTRFLAGPFGTMILADLGATVIKVEQLEGDSTRQNPPYFVGGDSAYFVAINRNKQSISLDIRTVEGAEVLRRLIKKADVVLDNLRAPQRRALSLDFEDLTKLNPRIVSCSVTGFGSDGPYADRPAYDIIVEALAGVMSVTGPEGGPSVRAGVPIGDITAGLYAAIGTLAGLAHRDRTGKGVHIDVSMLDSQISLLSYLAQFYLVSGVVPTHQGRAHVAIPTYNTFLSKDGHEIVVAANTQEMWGSLCNVLNCPELIDDPRFRTNIDRLAHRAELLDRLRDLFAKQNKSELLEGLIEQEVPAAPINGIDDALLDPQVRHREMVVKMRHRSGSDVETLGSPLKIDGAGDGELYASPPALGESSRPVLVDLGYSAEEIDQLFETGAVRASAPTREMIDR